MKKVVGIFFYFLFFVTFSSAAFAGERIVQLTVPGCSSWNSNARIGAILQKIDGVKKYENQGHDLLVVTFDDEKITIGMIIGELKKGKFAITGEPIYLKWAAQFKKHGFASQVFVQFFCFQSINYFFNILRVAFLADKQGVFSFHNN